MEFLSSLEQKHVTVSNNLTHIGSTGMNILMQGRKTICMESMQL